MSDPSFRRFYANGADHVSRTGGASVDRSAEMPLRVERCPIGDDSNGLTRRSSAGTCSRQPVLAIARASVHLGKSLSARQVSRVERSLQSVTARLGTRSPHG
jgi:hypothetical protein